MSDSKIDLAERIYAVLMEKTRTHGYMKGVFDAALHEKAALALDAAEVFAVVAHERVQTWKKGAERKP